MNRYLKKRNYAERVDAAAPVHVATFIQYLTTSVLELAGITAHDNDKSCDIPRQLKLVIRKEKELDKLLSSMTLAQVVYYLTLKRSYCQEKEETSLKVVIIRLIDLSKLFWKRK